MIHNMIVGGRRDSGNTSLAGYLFNNGSVNEHITGGWIGDSDITQIGQTLFGDYYYAPSTTGATCSTVNMIDLTDYSTIKVNCRDITGTALLYIDQGESRVATQTFSDTGVTELDISTISGKYYIRIGSSGVSNGDYTVDKVWLE